MGKLIFFLCLKSVPCSFLNESDNSCFIYDVRPKACAEYPHANRKKFIQITDLTIKNTEICPAAYRTDCRGIEEKVASK